LIYMLIATSGLTTGSGFFMRVLITNNKLMI
jgi:hypothetical protein